MSFAITSLQARVLPAYHLFSQAASVLKRKMTVFSREAFAAFTEVAPSWICWQIRVHYYHTIKEESISKLYCHTINPSSKFALLFLPGDTSHPATLLPLIDACKEFSTYSIDPAYSDEKPEPHQQHIRNAINEICKKHSQVILVGHSQGAIQSAYFAFVEKDPRILKVISIAGFLACSEDAACPKPLRRTIEKIEQAIKTKGDTDALYQIIAEKDWCIPRCCSVADERSAVTIRNALHLNILYYPETVRYLQHYVGSAA